MADFTIKTDNTAEVLVEKNAAVVKALAAIALKMEANAKKEITRKVYDQPESKSGYKRTGRLRNSITSESDGNSAQVGTNVEYGPYVELGTSKMKERPFIKPAMAEHIDEYKEIFERILENA
jgi:HK97 gp10 family phage protein